VYGSGRVLDIFAGAHRAAAAFQAKFTRSFWGPKN
jgi:hypothetical protein